MTLTQKLFAPGWYRAALGTVGGFAFGMAIVVVVRSLYGWDPVVDWNAIITVGALVAAPLGYLVGIGCFDYWFRWASGAPTIPEDHSGHGAKTWKDYFASTPTTRSSASNTSSRPCSSSSPAP